MFVRSLYFIIPMILLIASCASDKPKGQTAAEVLYADAQKLKSKKRYIMAVENLNQIKTQYPYSFYATHAELMLADIQYEQEEYVDAVASYTLFRDFHPNYEKMDYVVWRIAESFFFQKPSTFDRDLTPAIDSIKYYKILRERYPSSEHLKDADEKIKLCEGMLKDKERYIADFYFKTGKFEPAIARYQKILSDYGQANPDFLGDLLSHAQERIIASYENLSDWSNCKDKGEESLKVVSGKSSDRIKEIIKRCQANSKT